MANFIMMGKYTHEGMKNISADRTKKVRELAEKLGGKVESIDVVLGEYDVMIKSRFPETTDAAKASVEFGKLTGISFTTMPAIPVEQFDKLISG